ncbi:hypothetical protein XA68_13667 [Ophiocordyceps unilateralis]|uniref:DUF1740-domain-containing protein n=1 Tax=Ophiocordyceps unilateralis TaxID=268505 RepID=A0A2A9PBS9_OPHUN|nr:hypothetical protein XA68_13667 [Ophiocordyceps unilateralis]
MAAGDDDDDTKLSVPKFSSFKPKAPDSSSEIRKRGGREANKGDEKLSVPKFSSFKPKEPDPISESQRGKRKYVARDQDGQGHLHQDKRRRDRRRDEERHPPSQRRHPDSHRRDTSRRGKEHQRSGDPGRDKERRLPDHGVASSVPGLFVIDKKGDPLIRKYGLDRSKIPSYCRYGGNRVLGTDGRLVMHRDGPIQKFSLLFPGERLSDVLGERSTGVRNKDGLRSRDWLKRQPHRLRARRSEIADDDDDEGFLCIGRPRKRRGRHVHSESSDGEDPTPWRSIETKAKVDDDDDSDDEGNCASDVAERDDPSRWKSSQLHRQVKDHPDDIDAWLELVAHQDTLLSGVEKADSEKTARGLAEVKVHLLESALPHASRSEDRERVLVALMRHGIKIWTRNVASKKWTQISEDEHRSFTLWKMHLDYNMSNIATIQFEDVKKMMVERLHNVCSRGLGTNEDLAEAIYLFLRATRFIHDAGYKELAVAAWQGLLELSFFRPEGAESQAEALAAFRDFWESEVPRLGDAGARGWRCYAQNDGFGEAPEPVTDDEPVHASPRDPYDAWGAAERLCGRRALMPARTMDAGTDDDPFRVVMYSDIEPLLFLIPQSELVNATQQLIDAYLLFCGLPPVFRSSEWIEMAWNDQFVIRSRPSIGLQPVWEVEVRDQDGSTGKWPWSDKGAYHARMSASLLFSGSSWFRYLDVADGEHVMDLGWVEATSKQLVSSLNLSSLALYYLGLRFARDAGSIKKDARTLLKQYPTDVRLFNAYAVAEFANGNDDLADRVLASALESPALASASTGFLLFKTWSWIELQRGDKELAVRRLCASIDASLRGDDGVVPPSALLKARQAFATNCRRCLYEGDQETASSHMECLALLSYLTDEGGSEPASTSQGNISAAMEAFASILNDIEFLGRKCEAAHELMLQCASRMLYFHSTQGPFRRAFMREKLARFIEKFPRNMIFLSLFAWADTGAWVKDETRQLLSDKVLSEAHDTVSSRLFAISHELSRGNAHSTRAAFEHGVSSEACRSSVVLWLWYVRFCQSQKQLRPKARDVLYRALDCCPWSKEVMMEAFSTTPGLSLERGELRSVYEGMASKGLRIHVDLDGFLAERGE